MAQVTAALVKQLREMTNSPMMECKKALVKADGDIDRAVDILREMGVAKAVKRAGRATNEGTVATYVSEDGHVAAILELSCETDFVGTNPKFTGFAADLAKVVADNNPADVDALKACAMGQGTVDTELTEMIHIIGENMKIMRFARIEQPEGAIAGYIHLGGKSGVILEVGVGKPETLEAPEFQQLVKDLTLHIVASAPRWLDRTQVPADVIEAEKEVNKKKLENEQAEKGGKPKPPEILEKIAMGQIGKFYGENCLLEQVFVKNAPGVKDSVQKVVDTVGKKVNDTIAVRRYVRYQLGA